MGLIYRGLNLLLLVLFLGIFSESCWATSANKIDIVANDFARAQALVDAGKEAEALVSLADFLRRHSDHPRAGDAQYLFAEIYFRQRDFLRAETEFSKVFAVKGANERVLALAGLRLGECLAALGEKENAKIEWSAVQRRFKNTPEGDRAATLLGSLL